eukprot:Rmarinus@m.4759
MMAQVLLYTAMGWRSWLISSKIPILTFKLIHLKVSCASLLLIPMLSRRWIRFRATSSCRISDRWHPLRSGVLIPGLRVWRGLSGKWVARFEILDRFSGK